MTEAEGKSKYQILQKRKTKYHSKFFFFLQKLNSNTKTIAETEQKYQIAETKEKMKYQNNYRDRHKYQIAETEGQSKYQILQKRKTKYHSNYYFFAET